MKWSAALALGVLALAAASSHAKPSRSTLTRSRHGVNYSRGRFAARRSSKIVAGIFSTPSAQASAEAKANMDACRHRLATVSTGGAGGAVNRAKSLAMAQMQAFSPQHIKANAPK